MLGGSAPARIVLAPQRGLVPASVAQQENGGKMGLPRALLPAAPCAGQPYVGTPMRQIQRSFTVIMGLVLAAARTRSTLHDAAKARAVGRKEGADFSRPSKPRSWKRGGSALPIETPSAEVHRGD